MAEILIWVIGSAVLAALLGFVGIFSLFISQHDMKKTLPLLTAFAAGTLLGGAFLHLLPEVLEISVSTDQVLLFTLIGFGIFIILEAYIHWHHCKECDMHPFSYMMVIGDALHNFIDGLALAASFIISIPLGIATLIALIAHEFPQQLGIFGVLVKGGFSRNKAIVYSAAAQSTIILGALTGYFLSGAIEGISSLLVPFAAGGFIYIAAADLIPEMHKSEGFEKITSLAVLFAGLLFMWVLKAYGAG
jgi:zinc and cadmium transporter